MSLSRASSRPCGPRRRSRRRRASPPCSPRPIPAAGWWHDDPAEQLRNYRSWVYAAVNAIAQEVARQRPFLYRNTGQAEHEQTPLPHTHPLCRLLDRPEPVADAVGALVPHGRLPRTHRQLLLVRRAAIGRRHAARHAGRNLDHPDAVGARRPRSRREYVKAYEVAAPGVPAETFGPDEIIHLKYPNPLDPHYGLSPLQANALTVDANTELLKSPLPDVPRRPAAGRGAADRADAHRPDRDAARREARRRSSAAATTGTGRWCSSRA